MKALAVGLVARALALEALAGLVIAAAGIWQVAGWGWAAIAVGSVLFTLALLGGMRR